MKAGQKVFRLYDSYSRKFQGPAETRAAAWKRLSSWTLRRRDHRTNWMRFCMQPLEVEAGDHGKLTAESLSFTEERYAEIAEMLAGQTEPL